MTEREKQSFDFAADATKQIITLSTAVIGLTVTFLKDILQTPTSYGWTLKAAWFLYALAATAGLWHLLGLAGSLGNKDKVPDAKLSIYSQNASFPMFLQLVCFVLAVVFTIAFGWQRL